MLVHPFIWIRWFSIYDLIMLYVQCIYFLLLMYIYIVKIGNKTQYFPNDLKIHCQLPAANIFVYDHTNSVYIFFSILNNAGAERNHIKVFSVFLWTEIRKWGHFMLYDCKFQLKSFSFIQRTCMYIICRTNIIQRGSYKNKINFILITKWMPHILLGSLI